MKDLTARRPTDVENEKVHQIMDKQVRREKKCRPPEKQIIVKTMEEQTRVVNKARTDWKITCITIT